MENLILEQVCFRYDRVPAVSDISLEIRKGELFTLLGPSGCGKTTLLRLLAGFLHPDSGRILMDGRDMTDLPAEKRRMGVVFQNYALFPQMTVEENIAYGLRVRRVPKETIREKCGYFLDLINMREERTKNVEQLSGGQQQRVAIARALILDPDMLLMDEPLSNLDAGLRIKMRQEIRELQEKTGVTTLFITHDQQEALSISHRIAVIDRGRIRQVGTPSEIYNAPSDAFVAGFVGKANRLSSADAAALDLDAVREGFIRPEGLTLCADGGEGLPVTVQRIVFDGPCFHYTVAAPGGLYEVSMLNRGTPPFTVGQRLFLRRADGRGGAA
jgi:iron(III) transport system ATP-binding protein